MELSPLWAIESSLLEIYSLLVHRINGLSLSIKDFWELDTWTTSFLYCREMDLIQYEDEQFNKDKEELEDDAEVVDLVEEMFGVEE